jgi:hypothetical protein
MWTRCRATSYDAQVSTRTPFPASLDVEIAVGDVAGALHELHGTPEPMFSLA